MSFQDFYNQYNGQSVEKEDSSNLDQCFDLAFAWVDALGIARAAIRHELAYQIFTQPTDTTNRYFDLIPNTPDAVPQEGDIVVFGQVVGPAGHVCIASGTGDTDTFQSFDQNWDTTRDNHGTDPNTGLFIPYSHLVTHNYNGVLGWLRAKPQVTQPTPPTQPDALTECLRQHDDLVNKCNEKDQTILSLNNQIANLQQQLNQQAPSQPVQPPTVSVPAQPAYPDLSGDLAKAQADVHNLNSIITIKDATIGDIRRIAYENNWWGWLLAQQQIKDLTK